MLKEKYNIIKNNKQKTKTVVLALLMVTMILLMDISHLFVISDPNDEYTFFYDDFMFTTTNSTALWRGNYHISASKLAVDEGQISWTDFNIGAWNGYNRLILDADIVPDSSSQSARILVRDANSMEILYAIHPSQIYGKIDLSSYVDLTSTSLKLEIHGYCKFDKIRIYTPNLFIHNLLLDVNAEDFGTEILNGLNEQGENPTFSSYSKLLDFAPGVAAGATLETRDYFIPYLNEINLVGLVSRSFYENEECINDSIQITIQAIEYYGKSFEIHTLYSTFDMFDQQPTSFSIPLNQFVGKDIKFKLKVKVITNRLDPSYLPDLFVSYFGITAKSNSKINSRFIDAYDFATKDMFTQITPAMVSGEEKLVLARDRLGDIATYRAFLGTTTNTTYLSGYDLSEYLDTSSGTDGWIPNYGSDGLSADLSTSSEAVISLNDEQPDFTAGYLETSFDLNCYGLAAGIVFRYYSDTEFWAITVQRMEEGRDIAHLIHNGDIVKSAPLMRKLSSLVTIKIEKNCFLDYYQYSYLDYYQFSIGEQYLFKHSTSDPGTKLGLYYRIIDNTKSQQYAYPVVFRSFTLYTIGPYDVTRVYMKVQNPTSKAITLQIKEIFFTEDDYLGERIISTITVPHTEGFETIIAECINPAFNSRLIVESLSEQLIYLSEFGFIGYTKFGETTPASLYYDISEDILTDHRVKENCIVIEYNDEWVTYDIELKNNFVFYVYANATLNNNLVLKIYARKINTEDSFTFLDTIYFIEKDGKGYSHHFYDDLSTHEGFTEGIYEVKITVNSDISVDDPLTFWSLTATEIPDRLQGADYSDIDNNVEGWREEWDIDDGQYTYLNQQEWYTNVGFSSLNGGPIDNWALPYEYNYPEIFLNDPWNFEEDADGWDYAGVYSNIGTEDGNLDVTVSSADRYYFGAYYRTDNTPIDMINTDYNVFRINILVTEIPSGSNGIRLGVGVASDVSDFGGSDTWRYSSWTITETNTWYTFELTFDSFSADTDGTNIEYMCLQIINSPSDSYFTANTAKFKIEEIKLLNLELESGVVDFASLELGDSWNFEEDLDSFGLSGGVSQTFDGSGYLNYSRIADGEWGNVYNDLTSVTSVDLNKYTDFSFDYKVDNLISDEIAMIRLIFYDDKAANHYENIFIYDNIIFDGSWNTIKVSLNSLTITSCEFFRIYFSNQTGTPTLFAGDTILFDDVVFSYNERFIVEENAFYTTITSSDNLIYERFLGYNVDVKEFPFIEMKVRSNDLSICEELNFGIHSLSYGNAYATISLSDRFEWYRLNLYQLVNSLNDNDISTLTDIFIDKIILSFNGVIDITSIKIYSIADWVYIPSDTDTIYTTAHLENSQESILKLDTDSTLAYTANVTDCDWGNDVYGYWEYNLEFMLTDISEKTTLLSIFNENNQDYVLDVYIENNNIYFDDTIVTFDDTSFNLEIYRWFTLQCYSYYNYGPTGGNWNLTIHIEDTYSDVLHYTSNIGEINNVPNNITLAIETTDTPVYLRNINLSLNDSVTIGTYFSTADAFYYSTDNYSIDTWYLDTNGDCYLTKINQGLGGTIASSSMFLILDQGITFKRSTLGIEFMSPEDFYIYLQSLCYGEEFHIYINDYDINANGVNGDTVYELNKLDVGTIVDTITLTTNNDYGYISKLHIWGNYSWGDFYTNFGDGDSSLNDWSHSSSHPMTISNTGDMVISDLTNLGGEHRIAYYNAYFGDALISTAINCSSASPHRNQEEEIIGYHIAVGIVFNSQSKTAYTLSSYSGYLLIYVSDIYYWGPNSNSSHIYLYRYDNGVPTQLYDHDYSSIHFPVGEEDDLPLQVSTRYYNGQLTVGVYFNNTRLSENCYTSSIYESGYIGVYAEVMNDYCGLDDVQSGAITEFSIIHKYYYPESDNVNYNTDSEENFFAGGRLYVADNDVEINDLGDFSEQKNIIITFEFPQLKPSCFIGFIYDKDGTPKYYGYLFRAVYWQETSEIWLLDGTTTLDTTGGTLVDNNWLSENFGRTLYFVSTLYEARSTGEPYERAIDIDIQLFSEKEFRPDTNHPLNNMVSIVYLSYTMDPPYGEEPIFSIKPVLDKNNLIIHNIEFGGVYPIDKEWLDESVSHGIRGAGEIADYYLQAKGQGSIKVDTSTSAVWMERPFYVPEQTGATSISFTYLSSTPHSKDYVFLIYKDTTEFMEIVISTSNNTYEKITTRVKNGENYIVQTTHYVPYYQWITFSVEFSTTLELITTVAYNNKNLQEEGVIYTYLTVNTYYTFKLSKDIDSSSDTGNLYLASLALQNGAGFSSTFVNGDMNGWQLSDSSKFIYSTEVSLNPDSLTLYAEPFGGWCDITISVDDGEYIRTTRIEVEDEETFKPYLLRLPEEVDTTEIHKYTIIADGILTIYSIGFFQSVSINSWLITKPYIDGEIKEEVTSIGDTVVDFEDPNYSHGYTTSINDELLGSVGVMAYATEFDDDYLGVGSGSWKGDIGFWLKWNKGSTNVPEIHIGVVVINDYGDNPVNQLFDVYIKLRESSSTLYNSLKYSHVLYHTGAGEGGLTYLDKIYYNYYSDTNQWTYVHLDIGGLVAYYKTKDPDLIESYNYIYNGFLSIDFDTKSSSNTIYLDDITLYDTNIKQPGIFARSYTYANGLNTQSVWVPQQVNSLGYIDFNSLDISGSSLNEQSSFVIQSGSGADAQLHISSSRPFLLYQGNILIHTNYALPNTISDTYLDIHLYEGINRFTVRSISHTLIDTPWILKADILAPTNVEIVSEEYQSRKLSELNSNWFIDDWLVSDRPIYWESLDKYEIPQVGEDEYYEILYDKIDDFKMQELTVMLPYAGEQFNFTVPIAEYNVDVTEWVSFNYAYPNEDTGLVNYISGGMNNTNVDENDQIVYYTNLHFLDTYPNNQHLNLTYWGDIETIYYDSVYVYGKAGKTQHNDGTDVATESLGVNGTKTLTIDLWDWQRIQFYNETGHTQPHIPHFLYDINPRNPGVHRITIIMNAPNPVEVNSMDLRASLSYLDDNVNCFTSITEYTSSKQSQQEKAAKVQLDQRSTPADGSMSSHDKWAGKKIMESSVTFDGIRYHSTRQVYVGIDNYETYEDIAAPFGVLGPEDAIGLLTTMIIYDAGTRHESSTIVQQAIGPNADAYENYQPTQLCIPYTMTSGIISDNFLLNTNNIRLSYSSQDTLYTSFKLQLNFNSNSLKSSQLSITNQSYYDEIISQFDSFLSSPDNEITITYSLTEPLTIQSSNETLIINTELLYLTVDDLDIVFNKKLQILHVSYNDKHNVEEITVQLKSRMIMHLDPLGVHMSYKKAGSTNHGFIIYDIDKINSIGSGTISVPSHIRLGFFSSIKKFFKKVKDAFSTVVDAIKETMKTVNDRVRNFMKTIGAQIKNALHKLVDGVMVIVGFIVDGVTYLFEKIVTLVKGIVSVIKNIAVAIGQAIATFFERIFKCFQTAWEWIKNAWNNVLEFCKAIIQKAKEFLKKVFDVIGKALKWLIKKIAKMFMKVNKEQEARDTAIANEAKAAMNEQVKLSGAAEKAGNVCDWIKEAMMSSLVMDVLRLKLLFAFAMIFGTNVGMFETKEVVTTVGVRQFDDETAKDFSHVYQLDHVIDVLAGRQDLAGDSKFDIFDESTYSLLNPGQGSTTDEETGVSFWRRFGIGLVEIEKPLSRGNWIVVKQDTDPYDFDWFFGLRSRLQFGFGPYALKIPFLSEKTVIQILEVVVGILPVYNLVQDVKDMCLDSQAFFRILAGSMLVFDLGQLVGEPTSYVAKTAHTTVKATTSTIRWLVQTIFGLVKKTFWFICRTIKKIIGSKAFKTMGGGAALLGAGVAVFFALTVPTAAWALIGIGAVLGAIGAALLGIFTKGKAVKASVKGSSEFAENIAERASKLADEIAGVNLRNHEIHKTFKQKIGDFIKEKIRAVIDTSNYLKNLAPNLDPLATLTSLKAFRGNGIMDEILKKILKESKHWDNTLEAFAKKPSLYWITSLTGLDDDAIKAIDDVCWILFGKDADTFFSNLKPGDTDLYQEKVKYFVENLGSGWYRTNRKMSNLILESRLTYLHNNIQYKPHLTEILQKANNMDASIKTWTDLLDETNEKAVYILEKLMYKESSITGDSYNHVIKLILIGDTLDTWPTKFAQISNPNHRLICGKNLEDIFYSKNGVKKLETDLNSYYSAILHESGIYKGSYDWGGDNGEAFMRAYRKLHFNPDVDIRVQLFDEWVADTTKKLDVTVERTLNGLYEKEYLESDYFLRRGGNDDILIYSYTDITTTPHKKVYSVISDEYKTGVSAIDNLVIGSIDKKRKTAFIQFDLDDIFKRKFNFMKEDINLFKQTGFRTNVIANQAIPEIGGINYFRMHYSGTGNTKLGFILKTTMGEELAIKYLKSNADIELLNILFLYNKAPRFNSITPALQYRLLTESMNGKEYLQWFDGVRISFLVEESPLEFLVKRSDIAPILDLKTGKFKWAEFSEEIKANEWLREELRKIRLAVWDELGLGTFDANSVDLLDPYKAYRTLQTQAYNKMMTLILDKRLINNIHSSNMFLNYGYIMTGTLTPDTTAHLLNSIFCSTSFRFDKVEIYTMRDFRDLSSSQSLLSARIPSTNIIGDLINSMNKLDLTLIKQRMLKSVDPQHRKIVDLLFDNLYDYKNNLLDEAGIEGFKETLMALAKSLNVRIPLSKGSTCWKTLIDNLIKISFKGTGFRYSTDESLQDILNEEEYDYATLTDTTHIICFKDNDGNIVQINEQLVGFEFDWEDMLDFSGTNAEIHKNPFLLSDPFTINYNDGNEYMPRTDLERLDELYSADTLVAGDIISDELIGLRQYYEEYIDKWDHNKVTINYRIFDVDLLGTNQKTNWINYIKNIRHDHLASTNTLSYGPHITNVLFSLDINRQGLDMRNTDRDLLYTRMAYSVIDHENQVINRQLETWIVNMLRDTDDRFSLFRKSDTITYDTLEEFFNFYKNGKVKAFYDGADPGIDHQYYSGINHTKHRVFPVFTKVGFYEYANGTKTWGFLHDPIIINGYGSSMEEYFSSIKNELMLMEGSELWYWVFGCPIVPR